MPRIPFSYTGKIPIAGFIAYIFARGLLQLIYSGICSHYRGWQHHSETSNDDIQFVPCQAQLAALDGISQAPMADREI